MCGLHSGASASQSSEVTQLALGTLAWRTKEIFHLEIVEKFRPKAGIGLCEVLSRLSPEESKDTPDQSLRRCVRGKR